MNLKINFFLGSSIDNVYSTYGIPFLQNSSCSQSMIRTSGRILFLSSDNKLINIINNNNNLSKIIYYPYNTLSKIFYSFSISRESFFKKINFFNSNRIVTIECIKSIELDSLEIKSVFINNPGISMPHSETDKNKIFETLIYSINLKQNSSKEISFYGDINCFLSLKKDSAKSSININTFFEKLKENMKIIQ